MSNPVDRSRVVRVEVNRPITRIAYTAQNGKTRTETVKLKGACGKKKALPKGPPR